MFRRNKKGSSSRVNNQHELDLKLNLSPPPRVEESRAPPAMPVGPHRMSTSSSSEVSPPRSCLSSEDNLKYSSSPETTSMVLVGCPRCLMYVMLSESDPRCPKCKSTVLLDFLHHNNNHNNDNHNRGNNGN